MRLLPVTRLLPALALLTLPTPSARAQSDGPGNAQWVITYQCSCQNTGGPQCFTPPGPWTQPDPATTMPDFLELAEPLGSAPPADLTADSTGTVTPVLTWTPGYVGDTTPAPDHVSVRVIPSAVADDFTYGWYISGGTHETDDGSGDAPVWDSYYYVSSGSHLARIPNPGLATVLYLPAISLHAKASYPAGSGVNEVGASVSVSVVQDPRSVTISCPQIETSYYKGVDNAGNAIPAVHTRNPDGAIGTDSVVSWNNELGQWTVPTTQFYANAINFSNPTYLWSVGGDGDLSNLTQSYLNASGSNSSIPVEIFFSDENSPWVSGIACTVTDSDNTKGANSFDVTWHLPYGNWQDDPNSPPTLALTIIKGTSLAPESVNVGGSIVGDFTYIGLSQTSIKRRQWLAV